MIPDIVPPRLRWWQWRRRRRRQQLDAEVLAWFRSLS